MVERTDMNPCRVPLNRGVPSACGGGGEWRLAQMQAAERTVDCLCVHRSWALPSRMCCVCRLVTLLAVVLCPVLVCY